jgi:hypothetical protein
MKLDPLEAIRKIVQEEIKAAEKRARKAAKTEPPAPTPKGKKKAQAVGIVGWLMGEDDDE